MRPLKLLGAAALATAIVASIVGRVAAGGPSIDNDFATDTFTLDCDGFVVDADATGHSTVKTFPVDSNGDQRLLINIATRYTFSANGRTVNGVQAVRQDVTLFADGSIRQVNTGDSNQVTVPGHGVVSVRSGLQIVTYDPLTDTIAIAKQTWPTSSFREILCDVLAP